MPTGVTLAYGSQAFVEAENRGLAVFSRCACVLVAGGLGERLGYTDIKVSLPVQTTTNITYMELYVKQILAMQTHAQEVSGVAGVVPIVIMTSDDTHVKTLALLTNAGYFGAAPGQITLVKQEKVAAMVDNDARFALEEGNPYVIETKPHGHGDVHTLLGSSGLAAAWAAEDRKYIVFFQDTNALCFTVTIAAIGVSESEKYEMNSVCVPRKAMDAVGAITKLVKPDGTSLTVNVEYNQFEPMLKACGMGGDVNDPNTGFSQFPGNINQLILRVPEYAAVLARTGGLVPEFVNPKYADASKSRFKKPTRLECMMQEHPKVLPPTARVGFSTFDEWTYSPVKNSVEEARAKLAAGAPGRSAAEGELEFYGAGCKALAAAGVALPPSRVLSVFGFSLEEPPHIVLDPAFAVSFASFRAKFPTPADVSIATGSTLVVEGGRDVVFHSLHLDGALKITAVAGAEVHVRGLVVKNAGWPLVPLDGTEAGVSDAVKIRGFRAVKRECREVVYSTPGVYELSV